MSFILSLKSRLQEWRMDKKHFAGKDMIRVPVRDLADLIHHFDRLDEQARFEHTLREGADIVISIKGSLPSDRAGISNGVLLQLILMGYSMQGEVPSWDTGVTHLRLKKVS